MVYQVLNRLKWTKKIGDCEIIILHRGAPDDRKSISGGQITEVKRSYFSFKDAERETTIPMHRILEVRIGGRVLWKRKPKED
jgi:uncharacterized protein (UPF0248 family)